MAETDLTPWHAGRWFCSLQVAVRRAVGRPTHAPIAGRVVGVDAGIKYLAVLSTGELVPNPAPFKAALKKLGKAQRRAARRSTTMPVSVRSLLGVDDRTATCGLGEHGQGVEVVSDPWCQRGSATAAFHRAAVRVGGEKAQRVGTAGTPWILLLLGAG